MHSPAIEYNQEFKNALSLFEDSRKNIFITGKAGTGKSTLITLFRKHTGKRIVVLAPTGVSALNVQGETIHSFFGFKPDITLHKAETIAKRRKKAIYKELDTIIIDEISMVRADLLDCIERSLSINGPYPGLLFGGVQMIFVGDLYQLPPVTSKSEAVLFPDIVNNSFFFESSAFATGNFAFIELLTIYRQKDPLFIEILNRIRNNTITKKDLDLLNSRTGADFGVHTEGYEISLTTTNAMALRINEKHLASLKGKSFSFHADIQGDCKQQRYPTEERLRLKIGAQIMMLTNDPEGRWVNGTLGTLYGINESDDPSQTSLLIRFEDGTLEEIIRHSWEIFHFFFNPATHQIETETIATFTQFPLRLAWAVTIHKGQGKTFDRVVIDIGSGTFAHGQLYVALSRCRSLEGIVLAKPLKKKHLIMNPRVIEFLEQYQQ
ncbi:MAG: DEAD/DEAH box helicase [Candidatus Ratteibacteria bacterium]|jgi:ATP-dependent DNA helicase PIF1